MDGTKALLQVGQLFYLCSSKETAMFQYTMATNAGVAPVSYN